MNARWQRLAACAALGFCTSCKEEVTLYLSRGPGSSAAGGSDATKTAPVGIALGDSVPTAQTRGASDGGIAFDQTCLSNLVLMGFNGTIDGPVSNKPFVIPDTLQGLCGKVSIEGSGPYQVVTTLVTTLDTRGLTPGSIEQNRMCPTGQVVVGFDWRAGDYIDQLVFRCAPLSILGGDAGFTLSIGTATPLDLIGGDGGTTWGQSNCADGQVAVGYAGRSGTVIDAFGLLCATPSLVVK